MLASDDGDRTVVDERLHVVLELPPAVIAHTSGHEHAQPTLQLVLRFLPLLLSYQDSHLRLSEESGSPLAQQLAD
jgi:hypothetical protein